MSLGNHRHGCECNSCYHEWIDNIGPFASGPEQRVVRELEMSIKQRNTLLCAISEAILALDAHPKTPIEKRLADGLEILETVYMKVQDELKGGAK